MKILIWLLRIVIFIALFGLAIKNSTTVELRFFFDQHVGAPLSLVLLVTFAEMRRREGANAREAALDGARGRLRAVLMTAMAMIAGMTPMALGIGEGAEQTAPLGRVALATIATLTVLPSVYAILQGRARKTSPSLDPNDPLSQYHEAA